MEDPLFGKPARNFAPRTIWTGDNLDPECPVIRPSMPAALAPFYAAAWSSRSRAWWTWWAPCRVHWPPVRVRCPVALSLSATFAHERPTRNPPVAGGINQNVRQSEKKRDNGGPSGGRRPPHPGELQVRVMRGQATRVLRQRGQVPTLPRTVLDQVHMRLRRRDPLRSIVEWLGTLGHTVSLPGLGRYAKKWWDRREQTDQLLEVAAIAREAGLEPLDLAGDLAAAGALQVGVMAERGLAAMADDKNPEKAKAARQIDVALDRMERLSRVVRTLEAASAAGDDRRVSRAAGQPEGGDDSPEGEGGWQPGFIWPDGSGPHAEPPPVDLSQPNIKYIPPAPPADAPPADGNEDAGE